MRDKVKYVTTVILSSALLRVTCALSKTAYSFSLRATTHWQAASRGRPAIEHMSLKLQSRLACSHEISFASIL